jgi:hypothetical protein
LGHRHVDQLIEGDTLLIGQFACCFIKGRLKPKRKIAFSHTVFILRITSCGEITSIPKPSRTPAKMSTIEGDDCVGTPSYCSFQHHFVIRITQLRPNACLLCDRNPYFANQVNQPLNINWRES